MNKAYEVSFDGIDNFSITIVFAETAGKAKYQVKVFKTKDAAIRYRDNRYMSTVGLMAINLIEREVID